MRHRVAWRCTRFAGRSFGTIGCRESAAARRNIRGHARNSDYEQRMGEAVKAFALEGFTHVAFGDLFLEDVRRYREERLAGTGLTPLFPLWKAQPTSELAREMIAGGLRAHLTCIDPRKLDASFAGRAFDESLITICHVTSIRAGKRRIHSSSARTDVRSNDRSGTRRNRGTRRFRVYGHETVRQVR